MRLYVIILSLLLQGCFWVPCVKASEADAEWKEALNSAKAGEYDFAFINFHNILENYPNSRYGLGAAFAQSEYYFLQNNLQMASEGFRDFYARYPGREEAMIALAYLFKIAQWEGNAGDMEKYRKEVANFRHLTFIFAEKKMFRFESGNLREHKLVYYINKVDLYVNDQLFTEVSF